MLLTATDSGVIEDHGAQEIGVLTSDSIAVMVRFEYTYEYPIEVMEISPDGTAGLEYFQAMNAENTITLALLDVVQPYLEQYSRSELNELKASPERMRDLDDFVKIALNASIDLGPVTVKRVSVNIGPEIGPRRGQGNATAISIGTEDSLCG